MIEPETLSEMNLQAYEDARPSEISDYEVQKRWDIIFVEQATKSGTLDFMSTVDASDPILKYHCASAYLQDAIHERDIYHKTTPRALWTYKIYHARVLRYLIFVLLLVNMGLAVFEAPAVWPIPSGFTQLFEIILMSLLLFRMFFFFRIYGVERFVNNWWKIAKLLICITLIVDASVSIFLPDYTRFLRLLRPFLLVEHVMRLRVRVGLVFYTIKKMPEFFFLMFFFVTFGSVLAYSLFSPNPDDPYFSNLFDSFINMFVLQTTANYPDVTIPAFKYAPISSVFFVFYLLVQLYFIFNLNLATVYSHYKEEMNRKSLVYFVRKRLALLAAFRILDSEKRGFIDFNGFRELLKVLRPLYNEAQVKWLFAKLDVNRNGCLSIIEFFSVCDFVMKRLESGDQITNKAKRRAQQKVYCLVPWFKIIANNRLFKAFILLLTLANAVTVLVQLGLENRTSGTPTWALISEAVFVSIFALEIIVRVLAVGIQPFMRRRWNVYDFVLVAISMIGFTFEFSQVPELKASMFIVIFRLLRLLRFIRYFSISTRLRVIVESVIDVVPWIITQFGIILCWYYLYSIIGMEFFAGLLKADNPLLKGTDYAALQFYEVTNWNNILQSMLTCYHLMIVNNWHVTMRGVIAVTSRWSCIYFLLFWLMTLIILMNLVVASVIESFSNQFAKRRSQLLTTAAEDALLGAQAQQQQAGGPPPPPPAGATTTTATTTVDTSIDLESPTNSSAAAIAAAATVAQKRNLFYDEESDSDDDEPIIRKQQPKTQSALIELEFDDLPDDPAFDVVATRADNNTPSHSFQQQQQQQQQQQHSQSDANLASASTSTSTFFIDNDNSSAPVVSLNEPQQQQQQQQHGANNFF